MASKGSGYGGGGIGGGEHTSDNFQNGSAGSNGVVFMLYALVDKAYSTPKLLVDVNGTRHKVCSLKNPTWEDNQLQSFMLSKITLTTNLPTNRTLGTRSYSLTPGFAASDDKSLLYHEFNDVSGFKTDVGLQSSKASHNGKSLNVIYSKTESDLTYVSEIHTLECKSNTTHSVTVPKGSTAYYCILVQGAGGGGGGADNTWGLFNYASGGGGGGGGGACCYMAKLTEGTYHFAITVGTGGAVGANSGAGAAGTDGGDSMVIIRQNNASGSVLASLTGQGGKAGGGGYNNDGGAGGQSTIIDNASILTKLCVVDGAAGARGSTGNSYNVATSGSFTTNFTTSLFDTTFTLAQTYGSVGGAGSQNDNGGRGGPSYLGNSGHY